MQYNVSELIFELDGSDYLVRRMADYALKEHSLSCDFLVKIKYKDEINLPKGKTVLRGERFCVLEKEDKSFVLFRLLKDFNIVSALVEFKENSACITLLDYGDYKVDTEIERDFFVLSDVFNHFALLNNKMVLHGSTIVTKGKSVIFSAPSGTGKSTHTGLWKKYYPDTIILNDDTPVVGKKDNMFYAWGSPWSGKTEINENIAAPLAAVVFINRGTENKIERIPAKTALPLLINEARKIPVKEEMERALDMCFALAREVPIYKLYCDISKEAVETVRKELNIYD